MGVPISKSSGLLGSFVPHYGCDWILGPSEALI